MVEISIPTKVRRMGLVVAGLSFLMTVMMTHQAYVFWYSPPQFITEDASARIVDVATILAGVITLVTGSYVTRQIYRWSVADPETTHAG